MGRMKREIKKIENKASRQITFSKRRRGLFNKAQEISVLCDVDVAVIIFSTSGRGSHFCRNKGIEEIVARYVNMPQEKRDGLIQKEELLCKVMGDTIDDYGHTHPSSVMNVYSQLEDLQQQLMWYKYELEATQKRLSTCEGQMFRHITTNENQSDKNKEIPRHSNVTNQMVEDYTCYDSVIFPGPSDSQVNMYPEIMQLDGLVAKDEGSILELSSQKDLQVLQEEEALINILDCKSLQRAISPSLDLRMCGGNVQREEQMNSHRGKGKEVMNLSNLQAEASTSYGQVDDNILPWENQLLYQTDNDMLDLRVLQELLLPQFPPPGLHL